MKRLSLTLCTLLGCLLAHADGKSLFIHFTDGTKVEMALATTPEVSVADDRLTVASTETTANYELWTVAQFTYGETSGINTVKTLPATLSGNRLVVDGTQNTIRIFSTDGKAVQAEPSTTGGQTIVSLDALDRGIYIININGQSIKITRR